MTKPSNSKDSGDESPSTTEYTRLESPNLPDSPMVIDMGVDELAEFVKAGIKDRGTWSTVHDDGSQTIVNVAAVTTLTLTPLENEPDPADVRHLQPET